MQTSQVMIPKPVLEVLGLSDARRPLSSDWDLYLRIAARDPFTFVNRSLTRWRPLDTSASGPAATRWLQWAKDDIAILKEQLRVGPAHCETLVREELATRLPRAIQTAYYYGQRKKRSWAKRLSKRPAVT